MGVQDTGKVALETRRWRRPLVSFDGAGGDDDEDVTLAFQPSYEYIKFPDEEQTDNQAYFRKVRTVGSPQVAGLVLRSEEQVYFDL
jgi:hypothetical protein